MAEVTLFDLPSRDPCKAWSLNPWKPRLVLNYKNIPYKTEWVEYPDVAPKLKSLGIEANPNAQMAIQEFTIPAILLHSDGDKAVMDSYEIAVALEARYPTPSLHLDASILTEISKTLPQAQLALFPVFGASVPRNLLNPRSAEYFEETRAKRFGMSLTEFEKTKGGQQAWDAAEPHIREVAKILKAQGGPFCLGTEVSYADFMIVGMLQFFKRIDPSIFDKFVAYDSAFTDVYKASEQWLKNET